MSSGTQPTAPEAPPERGRVVVEAALVEEVPPANAAVAAVAAAVVSQGPSKPTWRGIPDVLAALVAGPAALVLVSHARSGVATAAAAVYGICLLMLFAVSAGYHTFMWSLSAREVWRRFDHSMVYLLIAGSYTPICLCGVGGRTGSLFLAAVWGIAALGVGKSFLWPRAPRALNTGIYLGMGWLIVALAPALWRGIGPGGCALIALGGLTYSLGAAVYARRWPNPAPRVFGYHEVFHLFVIAAGACHYAAMWGLLV